MGGLNTLQQEFDKNTCRLHLYSPSGSWPQYCYDKAGVPTPIIGGWEPRGREDDRPPVAIAPKVKVKGKEIDATPCEIEMRFIRSPDAIKFRLDRGVDLTKIKECELDALEISVISAASCMVGFHNIPFENSKGEVVYLEYSEENAMEFARQYEIVREQTSLFMLDPKKWESPS